MRKFDVQRDPYEKGKRIFEKSSVSVNPGITVLVGCNGAGKTTMLRQIEEQLENEEEPFVSFDNKTEGGQRAMDSFGFFKQFAELATMVCSSEGEQIMIVLGKQAKKVGELSRNNQDRNIFVLLDAVDSGFSIDNICALKKYLFDLAIKNHPKDVYIICTANSYEMARGEDCIDVISCEHVRFNDYEEYRNFVIETSKKKEARP